MGIKETLGGIGRLFRREDSVHRAGPSTRSVSIILPPESNAQVSQPKLDPQGNPFDMPLRPFGAEAGASLEVSAYESRNRILAVIAEIESSVLLERITSEEASVQLNSLNDSLRKIEASLPVARDIRQSGGLIYPTEAANAREEAVRRGQLQAYRVKHTISSEEDAEEKGKKAIRAFFIKQTYPFMR